MVNSMPLCTARDMSAGGAGFPTAGDDCGGSTAQSVDITPQPLDIGGKVCHGDLQQQGHKIKKH